MISSIKQFKGYQHEDIHHYILLLSAPILLTLYRYVVMSDHFLTYFPSLASTASGLVLSVQLQFAGFFLLMFIIPLFHVLIWWKKPLSSIGFGKGDSTFGIKFVIFTFLVIVIPIAFAGSFDEAVRSEYPLSKELLSFRHLVPGYEISYIIFYYVAWEFYFRGYLLFGLKERYGAVEAILIQTVSSCLIHIDKPFAEIAGSIPVGILLGYIALRSKSFWYVFIVHAALGVLTDLFIIYYQN